MSHSTRKVVPTWSDDSMYNATPVRDPFFEYMEDYAERRKTLQFSPIHRYESSDSEEGGKTFAGEKSSSETFREYNERIKRENKCVKYCSIISFIACLIGVSTA